MTTDVFRWDQLIKPGPLATKLNGVLKRLSTQWPVDALCIMALEQEQLKPISAVGLSKDALGRRFDLSSQPRLQAIMSTSEAVHFAHDSNLLDPFDGLISDHSGKLNIHDCMGIRIDVNHSPWGLLTLDALQAGRFPIELQQMVKSELSLIQAVIEQDIAFQNISYNPFTGATESHVLTGQMIGNSSAMRDLNHGISVVSKSDLTVLIQGETGTGKELVAHAIHEQSERKDKPYVFVNCAALPEQLAESELFGHVKGAFTGAVNERKGKFELAHGGTLFLDEVGELPLSIQAKLLRAIQSGDIQRVGSDANHHVDVRIVAATNRDLANMVANHSFRADLYHRLGVYPLQVPSLRERSGDILLLAGFFIEKSRAQMGLRGLRMSVQAEAALTQYHWPGNVREMEHTIARAALKALALNPGEEIVTLQPQHLDLISFGQHEANENCNPKVQPPTIDGDLSFSQQVKEYQVRLIEQTLQKNNGNWRQTALSLKMDTGNLHRLAKRLGLK